MGAFEGAGGRVSISDVGLRSEFSFDVAATSFSKRLTRVKLFWRLSSLNAF